MAKKQLTDQQKQALRSNGTVLVSAAAGSGKTSVLTQKVVRLLTEGQNLCEADRLLVVTFTNAAAAEMRARIEKAINEECVKDPTNKRLLKQKILLAHSSVCTIDSFCMDLVRENFYDLRVDPDFNIINEGIFKDWKNTAVTDILRDASVDNPEEYMAVLNAMGAKFGDDDVKKNILSIYDFTRALKDPAGWLDRVVESYENTGRLKDNIWVRYVFEETSDVLDYIQTIICVAVEYLERTYFSGNMPEMAAHYYDVLLENKELVQAVRQHVLDGRWDDIRDCLGRFVVKPGLKGKAALLREGEGEEIVYVITSAVANIESALDSIADFYYDTKENVVADLRRDLPSVRFMANATKKLEESLLERCRKQNVFTFDMIEHLALELLQSPAGKEIAQRYDWVLLDEYQDVNELQGTIFGLLSQNEKRLFAVGDVKQSIYGFRQADPQMFLDKKNSYAAFDDKTYPAKVILGANFRSRKGICDFTNKCFEKLMSEKLCGMDYLDEDSLIPKADFLEREENDVEVHIVESKEQADTAKAVAAYISNAVKSGMKVCQRLNEDGELEYADKDYTVKYKDFTILLRSPASKIDNYIAALAEAGIPVTTEKGGFWESSEIMTVCSALKAVSNPCDDIALLSAITAYPGGFTNDEVAQLRISGGEKHLPLYIALCNLADSGNRKAISVREVFHELRRISTSNNISAVVNAVYDWLDIFNAVKFFDNSENRRANLLRLLAVVSDFEKNENADLHAFCSFADKNMEDSKDKSAMAPAGTDAVRIMSIHKSKGLQFPVCILAECDAKFNMSDSSDYTVLHEKYGIGVSFTDLEECVKYKSLAKRVVSDAIKRKNIAEEMRLLYVAMTRAEDRLVVFSREDDVAKTLGDIAKKVSGMANGPFNVGTVMQKPNYANWIYMAMFYHPLLKGRLAEYGCRNGGVVSAKDCCDVDFIVEQAPEAVTEKEDKVFVFGADGDICRQVKERVEYAYPFEELLELSAKTSVSALSHKDSSANFNDTPSFLSGSMLTPAQRGTALHKFMQFCDFAACEKDVVAEADRLEDMDFISEAERNALDIDAIRRFFNSGLYSRIKNAQKVMREQRFLSKLPVGEVKAELADKFPDETVVIQGAADCLFVENGRLVVLDFKTDRVREAEELVERYATQLDIYGRVFSDIYDLPVKEKILYSFKLGKEIVF